jgi:tRNA 2-thiouridine synthesizing protein E
MHHKISQNQGGLIMGEQTINTEDVEKQLDCQGFLSDKDFWTEDVAEKIAKANDIGQFGITEDQWNVINFVRDFYKENGKGPAIVKVAKHTGMPLKRICELFPCGLVKGAYKIAGLPRPPGCV